MALYESVAYIKSIQLLRDKVPAFNQYPFELTPIRELDVLQLHPKVTYIIGENGTGKSTLLEAIAVAYGFNPEGGSINFSFSTYSTHSDLHQYIRLIRGTAKPRDGFFFRAESFYNVASHIEELDQEAAGGRKIIDSFGGRSLHSQSHGESFFAAFMHRFRGNGLYILDEPEAALSPLRQLSMLARIHELVQMNSQFIISTHAPILMFYPDALIYQLSSDGIRQLKLEETDHYIITKQFMDRPQTMLRELFEDE